MPITHNWLDNEKTILHIKFVDDWEWADYVVIKKALDQSRGDNSQPFDAIADFQETPVIPIGTLMVARNIFNNRSSSNGLVIAVGTSPQLRMLSHSLLMVCPPARDRFLLVATLDEAIEKLTEIHQNR